MVQSVFIAALGAALTFATASHGQSYPARPIRMLLPSAPG